MNLRHAIDFTLGLFCHLFAISMFFCFPGVQAWTFSALHPFAARCGLAASWAPGSGSTC